MKVNLNLADLKGKTLKEIGAFVLNRLFEEEGIRLDFSEFETWKCPKCNAIFSLVGKPKFCPVCGAEMPADISPYLDYGMPGYYYPYKYPPPGYERKEYPSAYEKKGYREDNMKCFACGFEILPALQAKYCPSCGALLNVSDKKEFEETYELFNVPIFKTGTYNGVTYTEDDLAQIEKNFETLKKQVKPPLKLGHSGKFNEEGNPAVGWVSSLKKVGNVLLANFSQVPKRVYGLIKNGAWKRISAEIYPNFQDENGQSYGMALAGVALLGADIPAIKTLPDVEALYNASLDRNGIVIQDVTFEDSEEVNRMETFAELTTKLEEASQRVKELEDKLKQSELEKKKEFEERLVEDLIRDGRITPACAEKAKTILRKLDNSTVEFQEGLSPYEELVEFLRNLPKAIDFSEQTVTTEARKKSEFESSELPLEDLDLDEKAKAYLKEHNLTENLDNYLLALEEVSRR